MQSAVYDQLWKNIQLEKLERKLDIMQAVIAANVGSTPDKKGENRRIYKRQERRLIQEIKKLHRIKSATLWEAWGNKSRKF